MAQGGKNGSAAGAGSTVPAGGITAHPHFLFWLGLAIAAAVAVADQASKWLIVSVVMDPPRVIPVLPVFNIVLTHNTGISFGLFGDTGRYILSALAVLVCVGLAWWLHRAETRLLALGVGTIIGGAVGNVIDRLRLGAVVDFLDFYMPGTGWPHFPTFNLADSAITIGVGFILIDGLFAGKAKTK